MSFDKLFDGSDAHLLPSGAAECAAFLRRYNNWRRGDLNIEQPVPEEIGLNIDFAVSAMEALAGHDHLMVIAATRYCLGRMTYIVGDCADWLIKIWPLLSDQTKVIIKLDIEEVFSRDDADREVGSEHKALGHDCDRLQWERVRKLWSDSAKGGAK